MPYISTQQVKEIRTKLKSKFPDIKFSIIRESYSCINVAILSAPINLLNNVEKKYEQVNQYYIKDTYNKDIEVQNILIGINDIVSEDNKTLFQDSDYGSVPNFYYTITIGKWDKPFEIK